MTFIPHKTYKRIRYRELEDGSQVTPNFVGTFDLLRGIVKDNHAEVKDSTGATLDEKLCLTDAEAKAFIKERLIYYGVFFLDEVRKQ